MSKKSVYQVLKENSICVRCRYKFAEKDRTQCDKCLKICVLRSKKLRNTDGRCGRCGKPWKHKNYKTCDSCRLKKQ